MSSIKIQSKIEIKHKIAKLSRMIKKNTGCEAFNSVLQDYLLKLADIIKTKTPNLRVSLVLYEDEYTFNHFVGSINWTAGIDENGMVNYCYLKNNNIIERGVFDINQNVPDSFYKTLEDLNDKV